MLSTPRKNQLSEYAGRESRLGIPLIIGIDAIHGNGLVRGSTIYPAPLSMASTWNTGPRKTGGFKKLLLNACK